VKDFIQIAATRISTFAEVVLVTVSIAIMQESALNVSKITI
jgi:hypothetical protein